MKKAQLSIYLDPEIFGNLEAYAKRQGKPKSLVADALSNKDIADRLFLSERTVETHVRHILGKLGFTSRTEIATWAVQLRR